MPIQFEIRFSRLNFVVLPFQRPRGEGGGFCGRFEAASSPIPLALPAAQSGDSASVPSRYKYGYEIYKTSRLSTGSY